MPTFESSTNRRTSLRLRADLLTTRVENSHATTWLVKDPLTLEHLEFSAEEYALMDWLRAPTTIGELQRRFQREFSPQTISPAAIWEFMSRLHAAGLLASDSAGQGRELLDRCQRDRRRRWLLSWTGLLGMRFRGIDPDALLSAVHAQCRWLFSPAALAAVLAIVLYAVALVVGNFAEFRAQLPDLSALLDWRNLPWLLAAIGLAKVLHELGHALVCKHFGGEVREMGLLLLVFAPCLYCDVSDAWRLTSKWQRIAVSSAGLIVELVLAGLATIVWWHAQPGVVQLVALNIMLICTLNTLLINGNPLMRYDGYYILADLVEVPNLWNRSREALRHFGARWLLGQTTLPDDPLLPAAHRPWLAVYAVASSAYLMVVCVMIVWGLAVALAPYRLENLAYAAGMVVLGSAFVGPARQAAEFASNPIRRDEVRRGRLALVAALGTAALIGAAVLPIDYNISAPLLLLPHDSARVYSKVAGRLQHMLPAGSKVERGDTIGTLTNTAAEIELTRLEGECQLRQLRVEHLERLRGIDREANDQLPAARAALDDSRRRLTERRSEAQHLILTAPVDGVVIAAPRRPDSHDNSGRLRKWTGTLLEPSTNGADVEPGTLTCLVGDPSRLSAVLLVQDADVRYVQPGQQARLRIDQLPGQVITGAVVEIARHATDAAAHSAASRADLSPLLAGLVAPGPGTAFYEVRVAFDESAARALVIGGRGEAKVATERVTLARWLWRAVATTFKLPL